MGETTNPYGATKSMQERILTDIWKADNEWRVMLLRYFNPIGAHIRAVLSEKIRRAFRTTCCLMFHR
jgi:UDP-glucose 4-epimerase